MATTPRKPAATVRLGTEQQAILECLVEHGAWSRGSGWVWSTVSRTQTLLRSLEKHRLVETSEEQLLMKRTRATVYRVTPAGLQLVAWWRQERQQRKLAAQQAATLEKGDDRE